MNHENANLEGRVCRRLRGKLEALGYTKVNLWPSAGSWRTDIRLDVYRWEGSATNPVGHTVTLCSWFTMTDLVKGELLIEPEFGEPWQLEVSPATTTPTTRGGR